MTMSAASDDAVAPRAPIATPTSAAARAGASLMPSPIITVPPGALIRSALTASTFSIGVRSARTPSTPMAAPTVSATAGWSPVTITIRWMPACRKQPERAWGLRADGVLHDEHAGEAVIDVHEDRHRALELDPVDRRPSPGRKRPETDPFPTAERDGAFADPPADAEPGLLHDIGREHKGERPLAGRVDDGECQDVRRQLVERRRQAQDQVGVAHLARPPHVRVGAVRS